MCKSLLDELIHATIHSYDRICYDLTLRYPFPCDGFDITLYDVTWHGVLYCKQIGSSVLTQASANPNLRIGSHSRQGPALGQGPHGASSAAPQARARPQPMKSSSVVPQPLAASVGPAPLLHSQSAGSSFSASGAALRTWSSSFSTISTWSGAAVRRGTGAISWACAGLRPSFSFPGRGSVSGWGRVPSGGSDHSPSKCYEVDERPAAAPSDTRSECEQSEIDEMSSEWSCLVSATSQIDVQREWLEVCAPAKSETARAMCSWWPADRSPETR